MTIKEEKRGETSASKNKSVVCPISFQAPLHYSRYKEEDYEKMDKWKVDVLLKAYDIHYQGTLNEKWAFTMGAFL